MGFRIQNVFAKAIILRIVNMNVSHAKISVQNAQLIKIIVQVVILIIILYYKITNVYASMIIIIRI